MTANSLSARTQREREAYDHGLKRDGYMRMFSHTCRLFLQRRDQIICQELQYANGKKVLELGSISWDSWIEKNHIRPGELHCINISQEELNQGIGRARDCSVKPHFRLMDAHHLEFQDECFDLVFGCAILHHLDFVKALDEIRRVLKPGGRILFVEPMGVNPIGKLVRAMTPFARTVDEKPLTLKELTELEQRFGTRYYFEELFSVPLGVLSGLLFKSPENWLMRFAFKIDLAFERVFPPLRPFFRHVLVTGTKK